MESRAAPSDRELLAMVLSEQKRERDKMKPAKENAKTVDDILANASQRINAEQSSAGVKCQVLGDRDCIRG